MTIVIKIGSNIIADEKGLAEKEMQAIVADISSVSDMGHDVVVVSSGAVAAGMRKLGLKRKPMDIKLKQASAAIGQSSLMWAYERCFNAHGKKVAQVLLTRDDISDRKRYMNSRNTLLTLISYGVIPVINENDTVAIDEIRFGDNDQLAAMVASLVSAERLIILSDVEGLYSEDPKKNPRAELIKTVNEITAHMLKTAKGEGALGTGGMLSKLLAADKAVGSGITVNIINGKKHGLLQSLLNGHSHGTEFSSRKGRLSAKKGWIAFGIKPKGSIVIDEGAKKALISLGRSLLPSGIIKTEGSFEAGDAVYCLDSGGVRIAKGLTNYSSEEIEKIKGKKTSDIEKALGFKYSDEIIHRDNMVILLRASGN
ncbi:MAG: glutamate 5-kinase [Nitrospirae bacterium]|nr:glutamate 5-kinase [Nitrospirota bacterium]